jgi:serine protease Do
MNKTSKRVIILAMLIVLAFVLSMTLQSSVGLSKDNNPMTTMAKNNQNKMISREDVELAQRLSDAFEAATNVVNQSVVPIFAEEEIEVKNPLADPANPFREFFGDDFFKRFFGTPPQSEKETVHSLGSGVIVSTDGYILTNNHVVQGAEKLTVILMNNKKYSAKIIGTDPQTDMAVIRVDANDLPAASLGNSDNVKVGQWVIAVGNPFQLLHTVTAGIISAEGRSDIGLADYEDFMQTDAAINPGNSGGALADLYGNVIGINTAINSPSGGNVGIGFAIPINMAKGVMEKLIKYGKVTRGYLALIPQDIDENLEKALNLKSKKGSLIGGVTPGGPAAEAGIKSGDVIIKFDGKDIENSTQLRTLVAQARPGSKVMVTLIRDGKEREVEVKIGERPTQIGKQTQQPSESEPQEQTYRQLGISVQDLTPDIANQLGYNNERGVLITDVAGGSPADDAGLQTGDLIKEVNRVKVISVREFKSIIGRLKRGDSVALLVQRGQNTFFVAVQIPQ